MTIPCANCGGPISDDAYRCPSCDALAPLPDDDLDRTEALPWAIPIRDGSSERAAPADPFRPVLIGVLLVAMLAGVVVLASGVLGGGDDGSDDPSDTEVAGQTANAPVETDSTTTTEADERTTTTASTTSSSTSSSTTTTTAAPTTTTAPTTNSTTAKPSPGAVSQLPSSFRGGWVAQLTSVPTSAGSEAIENAWSKARSYASGAVVTQSDDWSSMEPGYWVVVDAGPFESADEARAFCASVEHGEAADCLPRELRGRRN